VFEFEVEEDVPNWVLLRRGEPCFREDQDVPVRLGAGGAAGEAAVEEDGGVGEELANDALALAEEARGLGRDLLRLSEWFHPAAPVASQAVSIGIRTPAL
jgi:hypothetical protein